MSELKLQLVKEFITRLEKNRQETELLEKEKESITLLIKELGKREEDKPKWLLPLEGFDVVGMEKQSSYFNQKKAKEDFPVLNDEKYKAKGKVYFEIKTKVRV